MCGICGQFRFDGRRADAGLIGRMCKSIIHRGPDDEGIFAAGAVGMGMRRLNVIDLVTGSQPIFNETGSVAVVFNGEIYNFLPLREELEAKGHTFRTRSDTEVIAHGYEEYGPEVVHRLNGMFAFSVWDAERRTLFLARDRLGVKPLYYHCSPAAFTYGSEIKTILEEPDVPRTLDVTGLSHYLAVEYTPAPRTLFENIRKLPAGHWAVVDEQGRMNIQRYWDPVSVPAQGADKSEDALAEELCDLLEDAVRIRMISDVPLGAFLSGGIDSSAVVALMSRAATEPVKTFSIGFADRTYDETGYAREIAERFGTDHREFILEPDVVGTVHRLIDFLDDPIGDFSIFPTFMLSQKTRDHVTVALSGDGGDELFAGYETYLADRLARRVPPVLAAAPVRRLLDRVPPTRKKKGFINKLKRFSEGFDHPRGLSHARWMMFWTDAELQGLFAPEARARIEESAADVLLDSFHAARYEPATRSMYVDIKTYLVDDILVKVDRMSMGTSLEVRGPFLDYRVVEFALSLPDRMKLRDGVTKYLLRKAMTGVLPERITRRGKEGFSIPIKNWLMGEVRELMLDTLSERRIREKGVFEWPVVRRLIDEHLSGRRNHSHKLWAMIVFELWHDRFLGAPVPGRKGA